MRLSLFGLLSVLILAGITLPAAAQNPDALKQDRHGYGNRFYPC
jgi:hypothetical protein